MTFDIEELEPPKSLLPEKEVDAIFKFFSEDIKKHSVHSKKLVNFGKQSFIQGLHQSYADHRPFTLSPDIIWLLICQGFSKHVNYNSEELRPFFVKHLGKKELVVRNDYLITNPDEWENVIRKFTKDIAKYVGKELTEILSPDFTTTTNASKIASEITILETFQSFFEYTVVTIICGIPSITIEGELSDWKKIKKKIQKLSIYNLEWWTNEIITIIDKIIDTLKGDIDKPFWRNIYKTHTPNEYGATEKISGWISKFYPYNKHGKRTTLNNLDLNDLPDEISMIDFKWIISNGFDYEETFQMQFISGFIGLSQKHDSFNLKPEIGWFVCEKDQAKSELPEMDSEGILRYFLLEEMPKEILKFKNIYLLELNFKNKVHIPLSLGKIGITLLHINGEVSNWQKRKIKAILPNTFIIFNLDEKEGYYYEENRNYLLKAISKVRTLLRI